MGIVVTVIENVFFFLVVPEKKKIIIIMSPIWELIPLEIGRNRRRRRRKTKIRFFYIIVSFSFKVSVGLFPRADPDLDFHSRFILYTPTYLLLLPIHIDRV